jgi:hypothetical protein
MFVLTLGTSIWTRSVLFLPNLLAFSYLFSSKQRSAVSIGRPVPIPASLLSLPGKCQVWGGLAAKNIRMAAVSSNQPGLASWCEQASPQFASQPCVALAFQGGEHSPHRTRLELTESLTKAFSSSLWKSFTAKWGTAVCTAVERCLFTAVRVVCSIYNMVCTLALTAAYIAVPACKLV